MNLADRLANYHSIQSTGFEVRTMANQGPQLVNAVVSRGWGERIDGWALTMQGNTALGTTDVHLGIDEHSHDFRKLYQDAGNLEADEVHHYLRKVSNHTFPEGMQPLPRTTERLVAGVMLQHLLTLETPQASLLRNPGVARLLVRVAAQHRRTSLQASEFVYVQENLRRPAPQPKLVELAS